MESFVRDFRYALRALLKRPGFTLAAMLSLGLGIGANTTIFTLVNGAFLSSVPVADPDRVVVVYTNERDNPAFGYLPVSYPNYRDLRQQNDALSGLAAFQWLRPNLLQGDQPERIFSQIVTDNYFAMLGVKPALGRLFNAGDFATRGAGPVVVLADAFWQRRFGSDPAILGKDLILNGRKLTVVGVGPRGFKGTNTLNGPDLWIPNSMFEEMSPLRGYVENRSWRMYEMLGRLRPGVTVEKAQASLSTLAARLEQDYPADNKGQGIRLLPLAQASIEPQQRQVFLRAGSLLMAIVGLLLLIACANVASLLLSRGIGRRKEVAIRLSLGASRGRLVRQLLTESLLLSLLGGAVGVLLALWGPAFLWRFRPPFFTETALDLGLNARVLVFTLVLSLLTGLLFGLAPALQAFNADLVTALKSQVAVPPKRSRGSRLPLRHLLIVSQVALSLLALAGAGLFLGSLRSAQRIDPGFNTKNIVNVNYDLAGQGLNEALGRGFHRRVIEHLESLPGVRSATVASDRPLHRGALYRNVLAEGDATPDAEKRPPVRTNTVGKDYFRTLGIPLREGRDFLDSDRPDTPLVAIVNETMARTFWPGHSPLGRRFRMPEENLNVEVVGVAADSRYVTLGETPQPLFYLSMGQLYLPEVTLEVRTDGDPARLVQVIRREVQSLDRTLPLANVETMSEAIDVSLWGPRMGAALLSVFGILALVLAATGIYGVMAYSVSQRTREMGIRMALGARRADVLRLILRQAMTIVACGLAVGLLAASAGSRVIAGLLYGVSATDVRTFAAISLLLAAVALVASLAAARRGVQVDPAITLRGE
ncbi:MAG TPA: ABC transporter permease [Thermoanaerobaculia bacterium]|nr:ABC transporter permease [Thermoanaerobaculia bacterium]